MEKKILMIFAVSIALAFTISACGSGDSSGTGTSNSGSGSSLKTCSDDPCFEAAVKACSPAKYSKTDKGSSYTYTVNGVQGSNCNLGITVNTVTSDTPRDLAKYIEGKSMTCNIPTGSYDSGVIQLKSMNSCSGPLKDGMNEMIKQMMGSLAR